jgi:hypothetical protein
MISEGFVGRTPGEIGDGDFGVGRPLVGHARKNTALIASYGR